jgi:hypothetical protein
MFAVANFPDFLFNGLPIFSKVRLVYQPSIIDSPRLPCPFARVSFAIFIPIIFFNVSQFLLREISPIIISCSAAVASKR